MDFVSVGFIGGIVAGFIVGYAFALARGAWIGYRRTKASLPGLRKAAWVLTGLLISKGGLVAALAVAAVAMAVLDR